MSRTVPTYEGGAARCIFCGRIGAWWSCSCEHAKLVEAEKLDRPRTVIRQGKVVILLCDELLKAARAAGVIEHGVGAEPGIAAARLERLAAFLTQRLPIIIRNTGGLFPNTGPIRVTARLKMPRNTGKTLCRYP
jgi:hypothetical protein